MHILQINKFLYRKGGSESYMFGLAEGLRRKGMEVSFWGMADSRNEVPDEDGYFAAAVDYQRRTGVRLIGAALGSVYSLPNRRKIGAFLDRRDIRIAHLHNFNFQLTPSILPELKKRGLRVVYTAHDSQLACPYHRLYNFQQDRICLKCIDGSFYNCILDRCCEGSLARSAVSAIESYLFHSLDFYNRYIDLVVSPSRFLADIIGRHYSGRIEVLPNFVSLPAATSPDKEDGIVYVGRVSREKGVLELAERFELAGLPLTVIGGGPDLEALPTGQNVTATGPLYGDGLFDRVRRARFVIQPSRWFENCPMTVIEAFACGTPVIAPEHSGFKELIKPGSTGFFVDFKASDCIDRIKEISEMYSPDLSECCLKEFAENYSEGRHVDRIIKHYEELLNESI